VSPRKSIAESEPTLTKVGDIKSLVEAGRRDPSAVFPTIERLAASDVWQTREVAATALVEIGKRQPQAVLALAHRWARAADANVRRAASEGLRGLVKDDPEGVRAVLELLRADRTPYVQKSVANVLRNASARHPAMVLAVCREWAHSSDKATHWIIRHGLRKLALVAPRQVADVLVLLETSPITKP
jgi:3-methyladenine DNA glycosylase AlkC